MSFIDVVSIIVWDYLWGVPLVAIILGVGLYITIKTGFFQFTGFKLAMGHAFKSIMGKGDSQEKDAGVCHL